MVTCILHLSVYHGPFFIIILLLMDILSVLTSSIVDWNFQMPFTVRVDISNLIKSLSLPGPNYS